MAFNFYPLKPILSIYRVGNKFIFTDKTVLACYFETFGGSTEVRLSLCDVHNYEIDGDELDLGDFEFPNAEFNGDKISNLVNFPLCGEIAGVVASRYYGRKDALLAIRLYGLSDRKENRYQPTDEEKEFLKRVLCQDKYDENVRILDLNKVLAELEKYIHDDILRPYQDEYVAKSSQKTTK